MKYRIEHDDFIQLDNVAKKEALKKLVGNLTKSEHIISFETSPEIFAILDGKQVISAKTNLSTISKKLAEDNFNKHEIIKTLIINNSYVRGFGVLGFRRPCQAFSP